MPKRNPSNEIRRRGGQPGNQNALKHGQRTQQAQLERRLRCARMKMLAHLMNALALVPQDDVKPRPRPLRDDQHNLLRHADPVLHKATSLFLPQRHYSR